MILSKLTLNPRNRQVRRDLADCHEMHRTLLAAFPQAASEAARAEFGMLYRVETNPRTGAVAVLVQSQVEPNWEALPPDYLMENPASRSVGEIYHSLPAGARLRFRLRANPTKGITAFDDAGNPKKNSQRVDIRGEANQLQWLADRAESCGFRLTKLRIAPEVFNATANPAGKTLGWRADAAGQRKQLTLAAVVFEGELVITDSHAFQRTLQEGVGRGKAYGFGLLSIARAA